MHHSWSELEDTSPWSQSWEHCLCVWISASPLSLISVVFPASCFVRIVRNFADAYLDSSSRYPEKVLTQTLKKTNFWLFLIHRQRQTLLSQPRQAQFSTLYTTSQFVCVSRIKEKKTHSLCSLYLRRIFSTGWSLVMNCLFVFIKNFLSKMGFLSWDWVSQEEFPSLWHLDGIGNYYLDSCEGYEVGTVCIQCSVWKFKAGLKVI